MVWKIGNGKHVKIGSDPWVGALDNWRLSEDLIGELNFRGIFSFHDVVVVSNCGKFFNKDMSQDLGLPNDMAQEWISFLTSLFGKVFSLSKLRVFCVQLWKIKY